MITEQERRIIDSLQSFFWLQKLAERTRDFAQIDPMIYLVTFDEVAASTTASASVPIENDSDFYLTGLSCFAFNVDTSVTLESPNVLVQVSDAATNRNLYQSPIYVHLGFGTAGIVGSQSFYNPAPRIFAANSRINVQVTNPVTEEFSVYLQFAFVGAKVAFRRGDKNVA